MTRPLLLALPAALLLGNVGTVPNPPLPSHFHSPVGTAQQGSEADFDYLLGDWEFEAWNEEHGSFNGYWSAVRLSDGQILDEYRVVGDDGETYYLNTTIRAFNARDGQWELIGSESGSGLQDFGTARRVGDEMRIEQRFGVTSPTPSTWRIRYFDIRSDGFSWSADRSSDEGRTWTRDYMRLAARRIGPPRELGALTRTRPSPLTAP